MYIVQFYEKNLVYKYRCYICGRWATTTQQSEMFHKHLCPLKKTSAREIVLEDDDDERTPIEHRVYLISRPSFEI